MHAPKPTSNIDNIQNMEQMIDSVVKRRIDAPDKKQDRVISKTEAGTKKIEEMLKRLDSIEKTIKQPRSIVETQKSNEVAPSASLNPNSGIYAPVNRDNIRRNVASPVENAFLPQNSVNRTLVQQN